MNDGASDTTVSDRRSDRNALLFGVIISAVLSGALVIAGLKAGITPGVSPLVVLLAWGLFRASPNAAQRTRAFNIAQVAGSSGMAVTAGVIFTAPLLPILAGRLGLEPNLPSLGTLIMMSAAGALIGFGIVGSAAKRFLRDPNYAAPEARAAATLVKTATAGRGARLGLGQSLVPALLVGFVAPLLVRLNLAREHLVILARELNERTFQLDVPFTPIYIGIGALLTVGTASLVFAGSGLRLVGDYFLTAMPFGMTDAAWPAESMRWVGGGAMSVAVIWSLARYFMRGEQQHAVASGADVAPGAHVAEYDDIQLTRADRYLLTGSLFLGFGLLVGWLFAQAGFSPFSLTMMVVVFVITTLMTILGAVLSLQIGSSASPVSGTVFVTVLVLALVAILFDRAADIATVHLLTCIVVAACVAVCSANDASQDYRTLQICGVPVRVGFAGQLIGLLVGAVVVPVVITVAHRAYGLGSEALPAPQGQMFATLIEGLLFTRSLPWSPISAGLIVGLGAVAVEHVGRKRNVSLPSMALAVGIYLPGYLGIGILLGAVTRYIAEGGASQTHQSILVAAGLITGAAAFDLIFGLGILSGWDVTSIAVNGLPPAVPTVIAIGGLAAILALIYRASNKRG